jgi:hypothetical protein
VVLIAPELLSLTEGSLAPVIIPWPEDNLTWEGRGPSVTTVLQPVGVFLMGAGANPRRERQSL